MLSAEAKSETAYSETEGSQDGVEVKEAEEVAPVSENSEDLEPKQETVQDENDGETSLSTFSYDQLKAKSENPVTGIDFKRREVGPIANAPTPLKSLSFWYLNFLSFFYIRPIFQRRSSRLYLGLQRKPSINCQSGSKTCRKRSLIYFEVELARLSAFSAPFAS